MKQFKWMPVSQVPHHHVDHPLNSIFQMIKSKKVDSKQRRLFQEDGDSRASLGMDEGRRKERAVHSVELPSIVAFL